jgi:hypothetical protein
MGVMTNRTSVLHGNRSELHNTKLKRSQTSTKHRDMMGQRVISIRCLLTGLMVKIHRDMMGQIVISSRCLLTGLMVKIHMYII